MPSKKQSAEAGQLKRLAMERLKQRLQEDQMTTAELLKVAALQEEPPPQPRQPQGDWVLTLQGEDAP